MSTRDSSDDEQSNLLIKEKSDRLLRLLEDYNLAKSGLKEETGTDAGAQGVKLLVPSIEREKNEKRKEREEREKREKG